MMTAGAAGPFIRCLFAVAPLLLYAGCDDPQQVLVTTAGPHGETHLEGEAARQYRTDKHECAEQGKTAGSDRLLDATVDCMRARGYTVTVEVGPPGPQQ